MVGLGLTAWIFFFLRWLRRLERYLTQVQLQIQHLNFSEHTSPDLNHPLSIKQSIAMNKDSSLNLMGQIRQWIFQGNPVLKVAILVLVIGIVLLLRFATEHWQLSLAVKLSIVALSSGAITTLGVVATK